MELIKIKIISAAGAAILILGAVALAVPNLVAGNRKTVKTVSSLRPVVSETGAVASSATVSVMAKAISDNTPAGAESARPVEKAVSAGVPSASTGKTVSETAPTVTSKHISRTSPCIPVYIVCNHEIYSCGTSAPSSGEVIESGAVLGKRIGDQVPNASSFYEIEGIDPNREIAMSFQYHTGEWGPGICLYRYLMSNTFRWNSVTYQINAPSYSGDIGPRLGTVDGHAVYSVKGYSPSKKIRFQLNNVACFDAVAQ